MQPFEVGERGLLTQAPLRLRTQLPNARTKYLLTTGSRGRMLVRLTAQLAVVVLLLCLAAANIYRRATWSEREDGGLWVTTPAGVVAQEVAADSPAARAGVRAGDIL